MAAAGATVPAVPSRNGKLGEKVWVTLDEAPRRRLQQLRF
jgi:hypothetical protein